MINVSTKGKIFPKTRSYLTRLTKREWYRDLDRFGERGVQALRYATPVDTGLTAESWDYRVLISGKSARIEWFNTNDANGVPIAVLIQYGHGTRNGGWVEGIDYINPAMSSVFQSIAEDVWEEVTRDG